MSSHADWIFYGGDIVTMDDSKPSVEALAVKGGKILQAGKLDEVLALKGPSTQSIFLNNQTLLPGFIEPHQHAVLMAQIRGHFNISAYYHHTYEEIEVKMKDEIAKVDPNADPLSWCVFFGWDPELIPNMPILSADFLDGFSKDVPILVVGQSLHVGWANHKAFEAAGIDNSIQDEHGGIFVKDKDGCLTGQVFEEPALRKFFGSVPHLSKEQYQKAFRDQFMDYASRGFTTVTELEYTLSKAVNTLLETEASSVDCPVRLGVYRVVNAPDEPESRASQPVLKANDKLWQAGVKIYADGSPHCGSAAVKEPFLENSLTKVLGFPPAPNYGALSYTTEKLREMVKFFHESGQQIAIHAHGERAIDQVISVYEQVIDPQDPKDMRHRIEHLGLGTEEAIARAGKLNLALSFFVCHLYYYAKTFTDHIFGAERTRRWSPLSLATKYGITWTIHQDHPAFPGPPLPFANMKTAVTRTQRDDKDTVYGPEYRVPIDEAVKAYTINAAWQLHKEDILGSLTKNKYADLVILSQNPYKVDPMKLEDIRVVETFMNGRPTNATEVYSRYPMDSPEGNCYVYKGK